jgi:succinate--hydroxymethylglutarate CoA-transferase
MIRSRCLSSSLSSALLEDVKVLDLSRILAAPFCTQILGDMGATIFKIEHPETGDDTRLWGPPFTAQGGEAAYFLAVNRNKKSVGVNLKHAEGKEVILKLVEKCDVVVENFPPATLPRLGLSFEVMKQRNPKLIMASISGFGASGRLIFLFFFVCFL